MQPRSRKPDDRSPAPRPRGAFTPKPPLRLMTTTLWEYPSQHYDAYVDPADGTLKKSTISGQSKLNIVDEDDTGDEPRAGKPNPFGAMQGDKSYVGATPSWVIWQCLMRYTRAGDTILDPMCGSGTTIDVARDLGRTGLGFDLAPRRPEIKLADARKLPQPDASVDFCFVDPPYSTHIDYSDDERCIGKLDSGGPDHGRAYYAAMDKVIGELHRVLKDRRYMALYVSDSWRKKAKGPGSSSGPSEFMPIGFELMNLMANRFKIIDIICVVRHNQKLARGNWHKAAAEGNFFLRGFNYLFIAKKEDQPASHPARRRGHP
jgi:DNA modification methylase